jgi:tetratricopeptide (TPR) repeat protein
VIERGVFSQENLFVQYTNAVSRLAQDQPVIAVVEDLHWADASSLHLLFHLARNLQNRAVLFVCTHRLVELQKTGSNVELLREIRANLILDGAVRLDLNEGIDVVEYIAQRYPRNTFPLGLIERIRQQTEGHPLFVSQLFSWWEAQGMVVASVGLDGQPVWGLARAAEPFPTIPPTMDQVLEERIRSMQDDLREILNFAAVEGGDFTVQVITRLRQLDDNIIIDNLDTISRQYRLVQARGSGQVDSKWFDFYRFVQRFFREYIYSQLSSGKRRILHRQVGECLEALYQDRQPIAGQSALHFREARDHPKAARYALMAAQAEQLRCAWAECEEWCQFGLALIDETAAETKSLRLDMLEQSGYGYFASGAYSPAQDRYRAALALAQQLQADVERIALIYEKLSDIADNLERTEEALSLVEQGRQILTEHATLHTATYFKLEATWAGTQSALGNYDLAIQHLQRILAEVEQLAPTPQLDRVRASAYNELALAFSSVNQYAKSLAASQKAVEAGPVTGRSRAIGLLDMAMTYFNLGQVEESMARTLQGLELARQIGDLSAVAYGQASEGFLLLAHGKPAEAVTSLTEAIALSERLGVAWGMDDMYADLAMAYLALSDLERADQSARRGLEYAEQTHDHFKLGYALDALARVEAARQEWEPALNHFGQAIGHYEQDGNRDFVARAQRHLAQALLSRGDWQQAAQLLRAALATCQALELPHGVAETQRLLQQAVSDSESV